MKANRTIRRSRVTRSILLWMIPFSVALGQGIEIAPVFFGMYRSTGDWWLPASDPVSYAGAGIRGIYTAGNLEISTEFVNTRFFGLTGTLSLFTPEEGLSWKQRTASEIDEFDSDYTSMLLKYQFHDLQIMAGKYHSSWGIAEHSILGSSKAPSVPRFGFDWQILEWLNFKYDHAQLNSLLLNTLLSDTSPTRYGGREILRNRYFVTHRFRSAYG